MGLVMLSLITEICCELRDLFCSHRGCMEMSVGWFSLGQPCKVLPKSLSFGRRAHSWPKYLCQGKGFRGSTDSESQGSMGPKDLEGMFLSFSKVMPLGEK